MNMRECGALFNSCVRDNLHQLIEVDVKFKVAIKAVENANLDLDLAKDKHPR
jgi:hypothetical protein